MGGKISRIPYRQRVRSFNPIMRLSNAAIKFLFETLTIGGNFGHHEEVIATLLSINGFSMIDLGKIYNQSLPRIPLCSYSLPSPFGTMRHKPAFSPGAVVLFPDLLLHPLKYKIPFIAQ
ncbi:MAG: hypothetical protein NC453_26045 [Muribaculum sp.]|nr:hypothetical protein [Muribaculum sp.]